MGTMYSDVQHYVDLLASYGGPFLHVVRFLELSSIANISLGYLYLDDLDRLEVS